jgi:DNA-binding transcriptional regulator/RsmH inhibitor MraZ
MQLSARYRLRLPAEWRSAFVDRGILCWAENHLKLYPAADFYKWVLIVSAMHERTPLPFEIRGRIAGAVPVIISKAGTVSVPASLRLLRPGPVEVMGLESFIEIWPVEAWKKQMQKNMDAAGDITKAELLKILAPLKLVYIDLPAPPRDS